jgi:hypothetical protein
MFLIAGLSISIWLIYLLVSSFCGWQAQLPGPWYTNITSLVLKYHEFTKNRRLWIHALHQKYGPVVRLAPNEVSFSNIEGMKEIYQSEGSGYDKTEFYDLFTQYGHRTLFTTPNKVDVSYTKDYPPYSFWVPLTDFEIACCKEEDTCR